MMAFALLQQASTYSNAVCTMEPCAGKIPASAAQLKAQLAGQLVALFEVPRSDANEIVNQLDLALLSPS